MATVNMLKVGSALLLGFSISAQASLLPDQLDHQSEVIKRALMDSSVTNSLEAETHMAATDWLARAERNLQQGNYKTAQSQLLEAGRLLYPMAPSADVSLSKAKQRSWLVEIDRVMVILVPVAAEIAEQKQAGQQQLELAKFLQQNGRDALGVDDLDLAEQQLTQAYNIVQQQVVELRSGDELVVDKPDSLSRAGWDDAERRYADWRFFADWMAQQAESMNADAQSIHAASEAADVIYRQAQDLARSANWSEATALMDKAYRVMEDNWRQAGVDI